MARLAPLDLDKLTPEQKEVADAIRSGPRGGMRGPFEAWLRSPGLADTAQRLGAYCRYKTTLSPRLSEFAILCTARLWRAQFEWYAHESIALKAGVSAKTVRDLKAGRAPKSAPQDERAIYDFFQELYKTRRVSDRTYKRVRTFLKDEAMVELVGVLGYYSLVAMTLNIFQMLPPPEDELAFAEP